MKNQILIATLLGSAIASSTAFAEKPNTYVFIDGTYSNIATDVKDESTVSDADTDWSIDADSDPVFSEGDVSDPSSGIRLGGGLNFAEHWAIEVSMSLFGESTDTLDNAANGDIELATRARTFSVDFLRYFNLTDQASIYGRAGIDAWTVDIRATQAGKETDRDRDSGYVPSIGLGAKYDLGQAWSLRAELNYRLYNAEFRQYQFKTNPAPLDDELDVIGRYDEIGTDVELVTFSLGAAYRF